MKPTTQKRTSDRPHFSANKEKNTAVKRRESLNKPANKSATVEGEKLQKVLARAGQGSRREIEAIIAENRVSVDGKIATLGDRIK